MQEFLVLITMLLLIAFLQKGVEFLLEKYELVAYKSLVQIACLVTCYLLLGRYVYVHLLEELLVFVGFTL